MTSYVPSYFPPALTSPFDPPSPPPMRKKLLTYSYRGKLAYVPCADSHQEALEIAREVYPSLAAHPPSALAFYVLFVDARACGLEGDVYGVQNLCGGGGECGNVRTLEAVGERVGIAPRVWASLVADLPAYNIVYVSVDGEEEEEEEGTHPKLCVQVVILSLSLMSDHSVWIRRRLPHRKV
ncbi:hypothetical protein OF83DRAFT_1175747 [Amylostereum chailletii]|nr:hypothetical protein OF83DRAFT_1175747 [Amylostereum chailletii]